MNKIINNQFVIYATKRAARTFVQVILTLWTTGQQINEVDWKFVLISAVSGAIYSLLISILAGIPEVKEEEVQDEQ